MTRFLTFFLTIGFLCGIFATDSMAQNALTVNSLRIGTHPDKTRIVMELSRPADFRAFVLSNPSRIVIDMPSFAWQAGNPASPPGSLVHTIRNGALQPGFSRVVIELETNVDLKSAFILPSGASNSDRLVIDFSRTKGSFNLATQKTFGSLNTQQSNFKMQPIVGDKDDQILKIPASKSEPEVKEAKTATAPVPSFKGKKAIIVIDPGHGGQDPGALGDGGYKEKNVTLAAAKELKEQLEDTGHYVVHLTRSTDVFIILQDRVKIARKLNADLFISLHADSIDKPNVHGASIYTLSNKASDAQTAKLAARENRADLIAGVDLSHQDKEVADILIDLAMRDTMNQSKFFANNVVKQANARGIDLLESPHRFAGFAVLKAADIPSVLIEMGFMSNKKEVSQLSSPAYRKKIASAIAAGVDTYFARIQKNGRN